MLLAIDPDLRETLRGASMVSKERIAKIVSRSIKKAALDDEDEDPQFLGQMVAEDIGSALAAEMDLKSLDVKYPSGAGLPTILFEDDSGKWKMELKPQ